MKTFNKFVDRRQTDCSKWDDMSSMFDEKDLLPFWIADMDFRVCDEIIQAIIDRAHHGVFGYTVLSERYYNAISSWLERRHGWKIENDWIVPTVTVVSGINILIQCLTEENDGVIIQKPVYFPFQDCIKNNNRIVYNNALINKNGYYTIDFNDLEEKASNKNTKLLILCSPHNPVCRSWNIEELKKIIDICRRNEIIIISDEVHQDFVFFNKVHYPTAKLSDYSKVVTCISTAKTFNLAGLKLASIIIADETIREKFIRHSKVNCGIIPNNPLSIEAIISAYTKCDQWLEEVKNYIFGNFLFVQDFLDHKLPCLKLTKPEATYLAWIDFSNAGLSSEKLSNFLRNKVKVGLDEGYIFGKDSESFARLNVATNRALIEECLSRIQENL